MFLSHACPTDPNMDSFGKRFRKFAEAKYGSLNAMAERTDFDGAQLRRWANQDVDPKLATLQKLSEALDVPVSELLPQTESVTVYDDARTTPALEEFFAEGHVEKWQLSTEHVQEIRSYAGRWDVTSDDIYNFARSIKDKRRRIESPEHPEFTKAKATAEARGIKKVNLGKKSR